jgi:hypothetical protein
MLDLNALAAAPVAAEPFKYFVATDLLAPAALADIQVDFPDIGRPGIFPLAELNYGPNFGSLIDEIRSPELAAIMSEKFGLDLLSKPMMITVRGICRKEDGRIHTDTETKLVTALLYLNDVWDQAGGRLRFLRSAHDVSDAIAEVPPNGGTLIAFKRSENSFHGHERYVGQRRYVMFNWMSSKAAAWRETTRHRLSAKVKRYLSRF